jgi:ATP-dependent RNA helicase RhlE
MDFQTLSLSPALLRAVAEEGYTQATPIQERAIPHVLAGRDLLGLAQTGTGKTAAFALPMLHRLAASAPPSPAGASRPVRALVVTPTRELASQIAESFTVYGRHLSLTCGVVFGGVNMNPQEAMLRRGVDILVATPGRLLDHIGRDIVRLDKVEIFVLDEADQMLDMGFVPDVRRILRAVPKVRQTLFFSATMPDRIRELADSMLNKPVEVAVVPQSTAAERVEQCVYHVDSADKRSLLVHLLADPKLARVLVFARTKHGANRLAAHLNEYGSNAAAIHGNKSQNAREKALDGFKDGSMRVLVATDIAARGLDIEEVTHVVNYDLPEVPETYVHRIGRTARAGNSGSAITLCAPDERSLLVDVERAMRRKVPVAEMPTITRLSFTEVERGPRPEHGRGRGPRKPAPGQPARSGGGGGHGRPQGASSQARPQGAPSQARPQGASSQARPQGAPSQARPQGASSQARPQGAPSQARPQGAPSQPRSAPPAPPRSSAAPSSAAPRRLPGETLSGGRGGR